MIQHFLLMLAEHSDISLRFLSFRLDFNEHYRTKEPRLRSPLAYHKIRKQARDVRWTGLDQQTLITRYRNKPGMSDERCWINKRLSQDTETSQGCQMNGAGSTNAYHKIRGQARDVRWTGLIVWDQQMPTTRYGDKSGISDERCRDAGSRLGAQT